MTIYMKGEGYAKGSAFGNPTVIGSGPDQIDLIFSQFHQFVPLAVITTQKNSDKAIPIITGIGQKGITDNARTTWQLTITQKIHMIHMPILLWRLPFL